MRSGTGTSFVKVPVLSDNGLITKAYLRDLEAAIKQRTPIAGDNITIKATDGSYVISANVETPSIGGGLQNAGWSISGGVTSRGSVTKTVVTEFKQIELTVCSNGVPAKIIVFGPLD